MRYYALEALYNIAKVTREDFMPFFRDTFDALFRLCADMDSAVHQATTFLDNLMKARNSAIQALCWDEKESLSTPVEFTVGLDERPKMDLASCQFC